MTQYFLYLRWKKFMFPKTDQLFWPEWLADTPPLPPSFILKGCPNPAGRNDVCNSSTLSATDCAEMSPHLKARSHEKKKPMSWKKTSLGTTSIFLITGNFVTKNALNGSFNFMNLRFNFISKKYLIMGRLFTMIVWLYVTTV